MKKLLLVLIALFAVSNIEADPVGFSKNSFESLIDKLENKKIELGEDVDAMPLLKPQIFYFTLDDDEKWSLSVFKHKGRRLHVYVHGRKIFMARLFDERKGGKEKDTIYFCDEEELFEYLKVKQKSANQALQTTSASARRLS